jgi:hypothetical protein
MIMHAPKEIRNWVNRMRKKFGKKNGVINGFFFDCPYMELKWNRSKKAYNRQREKNITE